MRTTTATDDTASEHEPTAATDPPVSVTFSELTFSDGTTIKLESRDVIAFVGPNNAGKSQALRDLEAILRGRAPRAVLKSAKTTRTGSVEQLQALVYERANETDQRGTGNALYQGFGISIRKHQFADAWNRDLTPVIGLFFQRLDTEHRLTGSNPVAAIAILDEHPSHPGHLVFKDDRLEARLSGYFRRAFGQSLILHRLGGKVWPFIVGDKPRPAPGEDRLSNSYNERLIKATVPLASQGDGMRSFATVILHLLAPDTQSVLVVDEPEAFLSPPQARLLGEFIAKERPKHSQLFIATHSPDVLQGLLGSATEHLRVVRIQRDGAVNRVRELDKQHAKKISSDPLMKFSNVLSGVFHQRVIICESDADCTFYSALLDLPAVRGEHQPDVLFVHAGGKHRMVALTEALRALDVRVDVIADIDLLREEEVFEQLFKVVGGDWDGVRAEVRSLCQEIEQHKPWLTAQEVAKGVRAVLDKTPDTGAFPRQLRVEIEAVFRKASPWDAIKGAGQAAIPSGDVTKRYQRLEARSRNHGLWIVPVGELEGFCRSEGGHGPRWVQKVLARDLATDAELADARSFITAVWQRQGR